MASSSISLWMPLLSLSSSARVLGSIAKVMAGSANVTCGYWIGDGLSPRVSPVKVSLNFATAPISPACSSVTGIAVLPCMDDDVRELLGGAASEVLQRGVVLQHAGEDLEEGDTAGEGIADGLEDVQRERLGVADLAHCRLAIVRPSERR